MTACLKLIQYITRKADRHAFFSDGRRRPANPHPWFDLLSFRIGVRQRIRVRHRRCRDRGVFRGWKNYSRLKFWHSANTSCHWLFSGW